MFDGSVEPDMIQLYNKISHLKKVLKQTEKIMPTHDLRNKLAEHTATPESEHDGYVPYYAIDDEYDDDETRFIVTFATKKSLELMKSSMTLHVDATYRLLWQGYPVLICGFTSSTGIFFGTMAVLSSHEDSESWREVYNFIHDQGLHCKIQANLFYL